MFYELQLKKHFNCVVINLLKDKVRWGEDVVIQFAGRSNWEFIKHICSISLHENLLSRSGDEEQISPHSITLSAKNVKINVENK
jgi:hypothetical protein